MATTTLFPFPVQTLPRVVRHLRDSKKASARSPLGSLISAPPTRCRKLQNHARPHISSTKAIPLYPFRQILRPDSATGAPRRAPCLLSMMVRAEVTLLIIQTRCGQAAWMPRLLCAVALVCINELPGLDREKVQRTCSTKRQHSVQTG